MPRRQPRDREGWRIPKENSVSHQIYRLAKRGVTPMEMAGVTGKPANMIRVLLHRMRHPDQRRPSDG
jgi:hypothetical protein